MKTKSWRNSIVYLAFFFIPFLLFGQANILFDKAEIAFNKKNYDEALLDFQKAFDDFEKTKDSLGMTKCLIRQGYIYRSKFEKEKSITAYQKATDISKSIGDKSTYSKIVESISALYFITGKTRKSIPLLKEGIQIDLELGLVEGASSKMIDLGGAYINLSQLDSAQLFLQKALLIKQDIQHKEGEAEAFTGLANLNLHLGNFAKARDYEQQCLNIRITQKDSSRMVKSYKSLANIFLLHEDIANAEKYAMEGYQLADRFGMLAWKAACLSSLAAVNKNKGLLDKAIIQYEEVIRVNKKLDIKKRLVANLLDLSEIHLKKEQYERTELLLQEARDLAYFINTKTSTIYVLTTYGAFYIKSNKPKEALPILLEAASLASSISLKNSLKKISHLLAQVYSRLGQYPKAFKWQKTYSTLADTIFQKEKQQTIYKLETRHQLNEKEKQIDLLQTKSRLTALQLKSNNRRQIYLGVGLFAFVLLSLLSFLFYRTKKKDNRLLEEKNKLIKKSLGDKELLLKEIHHRVKNNLQVVSSLLSMQSYQIKDQQALDAVRESKDRVRSMALIHQNLYQDVDLVSVDSKSYVEKLTQSLFNSYNIDPHRISLLTKIDPLKLDVDVMIPLGLILNELISNALKYAFGDDKKGQLTIQLSQKEKSLELNVFDNGIGLPDGFSMDKSVSMGYLIVKDFCKKLKANLKVFNDKGTKISLSIPYANK